MRYNIFSQLDAEMRFRNEQVEEFRRRYDNGQPCTIVVEGQTVFGKRIVGDKMTQIIIRIWDIPSDTQMLLNLEYDPFLGKDNGYCYSYHNVDSELVGRDLNLNLDPTQYFVHIGVGTEPIGIEMFDNLELYHYRAYWDLNKAIEEAKQCQKKFPYPVWVYGIGVVHNDWRGIVWGSQKGVE